MSSGLTLFLLVLFAAHLAAFLRLALIRKQCYYWLVSSLFLALTISFGIRLFLPALQWGALPAHLWFRYTAWALACVTIPMMIARVVRRFRISDPG